MAIVSVWAKPGSKNPASAVVTATPSSLPSPRPINGQANDAVVATLAEALNVAKREVRIVGGHTGRAKRAEVPDRVAARAAELLGPA